MLIELDDTHVWIHTTLGEIVEFHEIIQPVQEKLIRLSEKKYNNAKDMLDEFPVLLEDTELLEWLVREGVL